MCCVPAASEPTHDLRTPQPPSPQGPAVPGRTATEQTPARSSPQLEKAQVLPGLMESSQPLMQASEWWGCEEPVTAQLGRLEPRVAGCREPLGQ